MKNDTSITSTGTHPVSFRISESSYQEFLALMESVPGSEAGAMYREIFARGLHSLKAFYAKNPQPKRDDTDANEGAKS